VNDGADPSVVEISIPVSDTAHSAQVNSDSASVAAAARAGEPDRFLAALLASPEQREALVALAALGAELSSIPSRTVREPAMGEIRLQWWRDALALPPEASTGHPVADAVRKARRSHDLPAVMIAALIDAHSPLFYDSSSLTEDALHDLLWSTEGTLFALGAQVVGLPATPDVHASCVVSGQAYGLARLLLGLPRFLAQGRILLAKAQLDAAGLTAEDLRAGAADARIERLLKDCSAQIRRSFDVARSFAASLPRPARVAFLPLALVEPYLRSLERSGPDLLRKEAGVAPFTRVRRIAAAHLFGRL
jgi:15-cis-phytoene synthase